jgi:hypothetical protein
MYSRRSVPIVGDPKVYPQFPGVRKIVVIEAPNHFPAIQAEVRAAFPELREGAVRYAANKITNIIRRGHFDCYGIDVSRAPMADDDGEQYIHDSFEVSGIVAYVRFTVD